MYDPTFTIKNIFDRIASLQSDGSDQYAAGLFPSQRVHPAFGHTREDNNIFFSALIVFTLEQLKVHLADELQNRICRIKAAVTANYPKYLHRKDPDTYNFWETGKGTHFPNGLLLRWLPKLALPADTDDTSLIYLTQPHTGDISGLKTLFETQYAANAALSPLTHHAYTDLRPYPSFLGKKIVREMDACVLSNVLLLFFSHNTPISQTDHHSIEYLKRVLERKDYLQAPFEISPHYGNSAVILYHISRLTALVKHSILDELRSLVVKQLICLPQKNMSGMEKLLISISLIRLNQNSMPILLEFLEHEVKDFYFFQAGMLTGLQQESLKNLASKSFFHLKYRCEAFYWALVLEYLVLSKNAYSKS